MRVAYMKLCCILSTLILTSSLIAQTTVKRTTTGQIKSIKSTYVPYNANDGASSYYGSHKRKRVPITANIANKNEENEVALVNGYRIKRAPDASSLAKREIIAEKKDTTSFQLYSQTIEIKGPKAAEEKEETRTANRTLPISYFQQNNSSK